MTGYVRKDTTNNIADGNVINAADLDAEFDGVKDAFQASTGHKHDGTTGEGAPITSLGPNQDVTISATLLAPKTTNTVDIGSSALKFKDLFLAGNGSVGGTLAVTGVATLTANPVLSAGTANGVPYLNGSKVVTSGSALTFDGTNLGVGGTASGAKLHVMSAGGVGAKVENTLNTGATTFTLKNTGGSFYLGQDSTGGYLGTDTTAPIVYYINNTEQMRLTSTGLGIGTSSPTNPLHIVSNTVSQLNVAASSGNTNAQINLEPTGTGIALIGPANNVAFAFRTNATERMRLDASGNLGLGVTPSAWSWPNGSAGALQLQSGAGLSAYNATTYLSNNWYYNAGEKYIANGFATRYEQTTGKHVWYYAGNNTSGAGATVSWTQAMTLDASGNLLVGTTSNTGVDTGVQRLVVNGIAGGGGGTLGLISDSLGRNIIITDSSKTAIGAINISSTNMSLGTNNGYPLLFNTNGSERARIDSSGNLLVKTTSAGGNGSNTYTAGSLLLGGTAITAGYKYCVISYATGGSGSSVSFQKDTSEKGAMFFNDVDSRIYIFNNNASTGVYLSANATSWTSNSDERLKTDLMPIENAVEKVSTLRAVTGRYKKDVEGTSRAFLIAQDVQAVLPQAVDATDPEKLGVSYTDVIPLLVAAIKEQQAIIESLKARLDAANL
jgi:hypothetical protein